VCFAEAGVDYLSVSKGGRFEDAKQPKVGEAVYPYTGASGYECMPTVLSDERGPFGRNVPLASAIRRAIHEAGCSTPSSRVAASPRSSRPRAFWRAARRTASRPRADARRSRLVQEDPPRPRRARAALRVHELLRGLDQRHKQVTCKLWDRQFDPADRRGQAASDGKRRLSARPGHRPATRRRG
jgi:hypothetical protein